MELECHRRALLQQAHSGSVCELKLARVRTRPDNQLVLPATTNGGSLPCDTIKFIQIFWSILMGKKGLNELMQNMKDLEKAIAALDGEITNVEFDPHDPQSIDLAIQQVEVAIDERVGGYGRSNMIEGLVSEVKERYRQAILDSAAESRMKRGAEL
ncbi:hypothetical protein [Iodidimonas sp. SYSU 1G8]|uniref:hypothetical protein n=1 Tax=Iodidimonas sp. SYSU 1G8 TaxID=3133967 RepID=UPI0031FEE7D9